MMKARFLWIASGALAVAALLFIGLQVQDKPSPPPQFVGTPVCGSCHQAELASWEQSHHRHAMEVASGASVRGDFNNAVFEYAGTKSRFYRRDGQYFVDTDNSRGELEAFRIAYTFGWYPLQQYLVEFPDGRLQALPISWDARPKAEGGQRWYHLNSGDAIGHEDPLHWTGAFQNWNSRCASCHSTHVTRNYSPETNRYDTRWQEQSVGCEACHGPGSNHVTWARGNRSQTDNGLAADLRATWVPSGGQLPIPQQVDATPNAQLQVCAACHARRTELQQPDVTAAFLDNFSLTPVLEGLYFDDGQIEDEVFEIGSFLQSRMHQKHVSCSNCHEPHSGELRATGNGLCLQCHQGQKFQTREHFFHNPESPGAQCVNCHMLERIYMGVDGRRDHSFRVPDPEASVRFGTPNPCTKCHTNRDDKWAARFIASRTGRSGPYYPHTALLNDARAGRPAVLPDLLAYATDESRPAVLRAIALSESARFASASQQAAVSAALRSRDPIVRMGAASALGPLEASQRLALLTPLLQDPVKAVRLVAARQLGNIPLNQAPENLRPTLRRLFAEYEQSLLYNADMPESLSDLALFQIGQGDATAAGKSLQQSLRLAPRYLPALLNLADLYRSQQRDDLGEPLLQSAVSTYPESADASHLLGLLHVRARRLDKALPLLARASELAPDNAQYLLVYALAQIETGARQQGITTLLQAAKRFPGDAQIASALRAYQRDTADSVTPIR